MGLSQLSDLKAQAAGMVDGWCQSILSWHKTVPAKVRLTVFVTVNILLVFVFIIHTAFSELLIMEYLTDGVAGEFLAVNKEGYWALLNATYSDGRLVQLSKYMLLDNLIGIFWLLISCYMLIFGKFSPERFVLLSIACFMATTAFVSYPLLDKYTDFFSEKMFFGYLMHGFFTVCLVFLFGKRRGKSTALGYNLVVNLVFFWLCWRKEKLNNKIEV